MSQRGGEQPKSRLVGREEIGMDAIRKGLLEAADKVSFVFQNAGKSFGFLEDGRDLVELSEGSEGWVARLRDHADEGWPEVEVAIPAGAEFQYALSGPLSRVVLWRVAAIESEVLKELETRIDGVRFEPRARGGAVATIGNNARLTVAAQSSGKTMLSLKQARDPDAIQDVLRKRATR